MKTKTTKEEPKIDIVKQLPNGSIIASLPFPENITNIDSSISETLEKKVAPYINDNTKTFRVIGYASSQGEAFQARRFSLTRAVNIRLALLDLDIHSSRIEIQALGDKSPDEVKDKVDIIIIDKK